MMRGRPLLSVPALTAPTPKTRKKERATASAIAETRMLEG